MLKNKILLLPLAAVFLLLAGCGVQPVVYVNPMPAPVVYPQPPVVVNYDINYWYDGVHCYYYDDVTNQYFWWNGGVQVWMGFLWAPLPEWHSYGSGWRNIDRGWRGGAWDRGYGPVHAGRGPVEPGPGRGGNGQGGFGHPTNGGGNYGRGSYGGGNHGGSRSGGGGRGGRR